MLRARIVFWTDWGSKLTVHISALLVVTHLTHFDISYNLLLYTTNDKSSDRISHIRIPEEDFAQWFLNYRVQVTKVDEEDGGHWSQYMR